jgi:low affinity Fe/Cu permease
MPRKETKVRAAPATSNRATPRREAREVPAASNPSPIAQQVARRNDARDNNNSWSHLFSRMANATSRFAGKPQAFLMAVAFVVVWALTGPLFGYSDTWQLVVNTATTIVTFLMVFLIQHTQNRDTLALQLKLAELIIVMKGAENCLATIEDMEEDDLEALHEEFRHRAEETLAHLSRRRGQPLGRAS